jgi:hypothetical protein
MERGRPTLHFPAPWNSHAGRTDDDDFQNCGILVDDADGLSGFARAHLIGDQSALTLGSKADPFFLEEEKLKPRFHLSERFLPNWDRGRI